jgi:uncharacterized protein YndB with AHSA1/START domain
MITLKALRAEIKDLDREARIKYAERWILAYAEEQVPRNVKGEEFSQSRTVQQLRNHFGSLPLAKRGDEIGLAAGWQPLIDKLIRARKIKVTNGFVWVT